MATIDPEWTDEKRQKMRELLAQKAEAMPSMVKQRALKERYLRGEYHDDDGPRVEAEMDPD